MQLDFRKRNGYETWTNRNCKNQAKPNISRNCRVVHGCCGNTCNILIFRLSAKRVWLFQFKDLSRNERNMQDVHRIQGDLKGNEKKRKGNEMKTKRRRTHLKKRMPAEIKRMSQKIRKEKQENERQLKTRGLEGKCENERK